MLFTQPLFLFLLLPAACAVFYALVPKLGPSFGLGALLLISLIFYLPWGLFYFSLLIVSITVNFLAAYLLLVTPDSQIRQRRAALTLGLAYDFGTLIWFKYRVPLFQGLGLTNSGDNFSLVDAAIPIGISFYTFQQGIFLVDAYQRDPSVVAYLGDLGARWGALRAYVHHAFFVAFFPHLVIGPIVYLKEFQPQVENGQFGRLRVRNLEVGLTLIAIGLFKKIVLADNLAPLANLVFLGADNRQDLAPSMAWFGAFAYYGQLYFDFSGYSDMAVGTARVLGVVFPINFYSPLKAVGIVDFYRRWHITLTRVIARFFYMPLSISGARFAAQRQWSGLLGRLAAQWLPLSLNFLAIALWHGARSTFVLFGLIHGAWYIAETEIRRTKKWKSWKKQVPDDIRGVLGRILFTFIMVQTFALFRSDSIGSFFFMWSHMFWPAGSVTAGDVGVSVRDYGLFAFAFGVIWFMPNATEVLRLYRPGLITYPNQVYVWSWLRFAWRPNVLWACWGAGLVIGAMYFLTRQSPFLYMGF